ncbi:ATP-binding protein [Luteimonas sp. A482]
MSWIDFVWPMISAACLTLAAVHVVIWLKRRSEIASLLFALTAIAVGAIAIIELRMMHVDAPAQYMRLVRWAHVPVAVLVLAMVGFVLVYFRAGSRFLAAVTCVSRLACLVVNFLSAGNLNYLEVGSLQRLPIGDGTHIPVPLDVVANPWMALGHLNSILLALFLLSAIVEVWQRGCPAERRRVLVVCGGMVVFTLLATQWTWAVVHGHVRGPLMFSPAFLLVVMAMSYELGGNLLRASQLSHDLVDAQRHLRESERRIDLAVRSAGVGLWSWDIARGTSWFSDHAHRLLGFAEDAPLDMQRFVQGVDAEDRPGLVCSLEARGGDDEIRYEFRFHPPVGRMCWIALRGQADFESGTAVRVNGVLADVSERKEAEEHFRLVVEAAPMALLVVDMADAITLANQQAESMFGYTRDELLGKCIDLLVPASVRRTPEANMPDFMPMPLVVGEGRGMFGIRKDGTEIPIDVARTPMSTASGRSALLSVIDLSERMRMERESALQRDELAHLARVVLLAELSGSLAHELNQPLTAILANAQAAIRYLDHVPPNLDEVREGLANIVESDKRAGDVIRRLRALLRKESSDFRQLDMNGVVVDVVRILQSDLLGRGVMVRLDLAKMLPQVCGDKVQLQQVLINLVVNACDAMRDVRRPRRLVVSTVLSDDGRVETSVRDIGGGIPEDDLDRIFTPFVSTKEDGLGLGLAVCRTILSAHAGFIWATNNAGSGTTVTFSLPLHGTADSPR